MERHVWNQPKRESMREGSQVSDISEAVRHLGI